MVIKQKYPLTPQMAYEIRRSSCNQVLEDSTKGKESHHSFHLMVKNRTAEVDKAKNRAGEHAELDEVAETDLAESKLFANFCSAVCVF